MGRRVAFCTNGMCDTVANNTNGYRVSKTIVPIPGEQFSFYDDGVGSDGMPIRKLLVGAFGTGLFQKNEVGYSAIATVYEAGDELFIFGFSRGAYTARSMAGMIAACGLRTVNPGTNPVETAILAYRNKDKRVTILATLGDYGLARIVWTPSMSRGLLSGRSPSREELRKTQLSPRACRPAARPTALTGLAISGLSTARSSRPTPPNPWSHRTRATWRNFELGI